jgi:ATP-dependent DNA helicase RecQ
LQTPNNVLQTPLSILQHYWKHNHFRPLQEDIVNSVLAAHDTLALLPTGGGKSVCFQVPGLLLEGVCIVISPLIALMKDQVEQLKRRGILAVAIHAGLSKSEVDLYLNNALYGGVKFLYVSPERIQTELFIERFKQMKVALVAVDEAHCISQWGYDFRPPYLKIAALRQWHPTVPMLALTATATPQVSKDIVERLAFKKSHQVFQKSFARENLSFVVRTTDSKERKLVEILRKVKGSAIVYVRSRKATELLSRMLNQQKISSAFYHAGLAHNMRSKLQDDWIANRTRVMVSTNAFGMGIDKPDVRVVVHMDLPENIEAYYQEAGRAGRDGNRSYAVIIFQQADADSLRTKVEQSQPTFELLQRVYQALCNYFQLAMGGSNGESYDFDLHHFCDRFQFFNHEAYNTLKKLEESGLILFNESYYAPSRLWVTVDKGRLYEFQIANEKFDPVIKMLLRLYGGELFADYLQISESYLAEGLKISKQALTELLTHLHKLQVVQYIPLKDQPQVTFVLPRQDVKYLPVDRKLLEERRTLAIAKMNAIIDFVSSGHRCRMQLIQEYFGEQLFDTCGMCDVCIERRKKENSKSVNELRKQIIFLTKEQLFTIDELEERISPADTELFVEVVRELVDEGAIFYDDVWRLRFKQ